MIPSDIQARARTLHAHLAGLPPDDGTVMGSCRGCRVLALALLAEQRFSAEAIAAVDASEARALREWGRSWLRKWWRRWRALKPKYLPGSERLVHGRPHDRRMADDHSA